MNKLLTIFALVAASAACCAALTDQEQEIDLLLGREKSHAPFCLDEREAIRADVKRRANQDSSKISEIFFGNATEHPDKMMVLEKKMVEEFSKGIEQADKVEEGPLPEDQIYEMIEAGKRDIRSGVLSHRTSVFLKIGEVMHNIANSAIFLRLARARTQLTRDNMLWGLVQTCDQVADYERRIESDWAVFQAELMAKAESDDVKRFINSVSVYSLNCRTTRHIRGLAEFCNFLKSDPTPLMKMLGLGRKFKLPSGEQQL